MGRISVGIGLRDRYIEPLLQLRDRRAIDVLEVMIDEALTDGPKRAAWRQLGARWPLIAHGTELGICDAAGPDPHYLEHIHEATKALHVHWYSEHLSFLNAGGFALGHFAPMFDDDESRASLARNSAAVRASLHCPLLLENPADVLSHNNLVQRRGASSGRAYSRALAAAECGALLDLTNLVYNARNDGYRPADYLAALDWQRVVQLHLAGGRLVDGLWLDSHDQEVDEEALALLPLVVRKASQLRAIIIERDDRLPPLDKLLEEVKNVRAILAKAAA